MPLDSLDEWRGHLREAAWSARLNVLDCQIGIMQNCWGAPACSGAELEAWLPPARFNNPEATFLERFYLAWAITDAAESLLNVAVKRLDDLLGSPNVLPTADVERAVNAAIAIEVDELVDWLPKQTSAWMLDIIHANRRWLRETGSRAKRHVADRLALRFQDWRVKFNSAVSETPPSIAATTGSGTAIFRGKGLYYVDGQLIRLDGAQANVLETLVRLGAATKDELVERSGVADAPRVLKNICRRFPQLESHITFPGGRGRGGYRTTIRRE